MPCLPNNFGEVIERPNEEVKNSSRHQIRVGEASRLRKDVPGSDVLAQSEQVPSEADSICGLRQDDLALIRSKEP